MKSILTIALLAITAAVSAAQTITPPAPPVISRSEFADLVKRISVLEAKLANVAAVPATPYAPSVVKTTKVLPNGTVVTIASPVASATTTEFVAGPNFSPDNFGDTATYKTVNGATYRCSDGNCQRVNATTSGPIRRWFGR